MNQQFIRLEREEVELDVAAVAAKLDRTDILLLRQFYFIRSLAPHNTEGHILRLLVDKLQRNGGLAGRQLSLCALHRKESRIWFPRVLWVSSLSTSGTPRGESGVESW